MRKRPRAKMPLHETASTASPASAALPQVPLAAVFSFLKDTRAIVNWTEQDLIRTLHVTRQDAAKILPLLQMQGYVTQTERGKWLTTAAGESVSESSAPRFKVEQVDAALSALAERIAIVNKDKSAEFRVAQAVAFGDFLSTPPKCQAADVGVELAPRKQSGNPQKFLKALNQKSPPIKLKLFETWMSQRTHRRLL
jgi:hypothetical protein